MERRGHAILRYLVDLRSILLGFAIFNFAVTWMMTAELRFMCMRPSYHPFGYLKVPTILLISSLFLSANRWWGNTVALLVNGYLIGYFFPILLMIDDPVALGDEWRLIGMYSPYLLFSLIVFCYSALSLERNFLSRRHGNRRITIAPGGISR